MSDATSLTNQFLIAMPNLTDPIFAKTVVYICEHNAEGAVGIIVNVPLDNIALSDVFSQMQIQSDDEIIKKAPVFYGGPLQQERGFVIHRPSGVWKSTLMMSDDLAITTSQDILEALAQSKGPAESLVALGYAGWSPNQLEEELMENFWLNCTASTDILFNTPTEERWKRAAALLSIDLDTWSGSTGHA